MTDNQGEQIERSILELALVSPKAAFMLLVLEIDRELRKLLASTGALKRYMEHPAPTPPEAMKILSSISGAIIPVELKNKIAEFWIIRNSILHHNIEDPAPVAFDHGLSVLRVLRNVPRPSYIVKKANVDLFSDKLCRVRRQDVKGVLIETFGADGQSQLQQVHPSRQEYYKEGMSLTWEWNYDRHVSWGETWYKNPTNAQCTLAWSESMEFIGRDINQV
jgi:hypothetical protein